MASTSLKVTQCPPARITEALALVLCELPPSLRREMAHTLLDELDPAELAHEALCVALRAERLCGAAWGQRQSGRIATFWPAQLVPGEGDDTAQMLSQSVVRLLDATSVELTQAILPFDDSSKPPVLEAVGFHHLADLYYLSCEAANFPPEEPFSTIRFEPYRGHERQRLIRLVERTYEQTLDCVGLEGVRTVDEVITGYQGTGVYRNENWLFVRQNGEDIGVLLLAEHPDACHLELMYMGLIPELRGLGLGRHIVRHAKWIAARRLAERIVLAVDVTNKPAVRMYQFEGFSAWDKRSVYVRFPASTELK